MGTCDPYGDGRAHLHVERCYLQGIGDGRNELMEELRQKQRDGIGFVVIPPNTEEQGS